MAVKSFIGLAPGKFGAIPWHLNLNNETKKVG